MSKACGRPGGRDEQRDPANRELLPVESAVSCWQHYRAELFAYDPTEPSQLLGKWRISTQLDRKLQPLRVGVVADPISKTIGRVTVQEGDGLDGASEAMLRLGAMSATARARALRRWRPSLAASCPTSGRRSR
jgi:hypothetical protein